MLQCSCSRFLYSGIHYGKHLLSITHKPAWSNKSRFQIIMFNTILNKMLIILWREQRRKRILFKWNTELIKLLDRNFPLVKNLGSENQIFGANSITEKVKINILHFIYVTTYLLVQKEIMTVQRKILIITWSS